MNERLAKLTEQCYEYNETMQSAWFNKTKFAELIVRECIEVIVRNKHATLNIDNFTEEKAQGIQLGLEFATIDIAEHFGIEE